MVQKVKKQSKITKKTIKSGPGGSKNNGKTLKNNQLSSKQQPQGAAAPWGRRRRRGHCFWTNEDGVLPKL